MHNEARGVRWAFIPFAVATVLHIVVMVIPATALIQPTKLALMPALALGIVLAARGLTATAPLTLLLVAVFFSWLGDGAETFIPFAPTLPTMLAFFGIAHLAYIVLLTRHISVRRWPVWALAFVVWWVAMLIIIGPHAGSLVIALAAYGLVLGTTAAAATRCSPTVIVGGLFFLASDTILAFRLFLPDAMPDGTRPAVMITYCIGQALIAVGVIATLRRRQPTPATSHPNDARELTT